MTTMRGADAILRSLEAEGVDVMFGIPGGAIMPTYDAMARGTTVRHVLARHEQGAGHMAEGYARASGRPGVAIATSGPGATNLVTPIADAWMDSTPLVCITGQVRTTLIGTDAFQECDITGVTMPIVKHSWLVQDAKDIPHVLKEAFHVATTGRSGPVLVDVPRDVQETEFDFRYPDSVDLPGWRPPAKVHPLQIREAARVLARAEKPVLYVGGGTLNGDACDELRDLAEAGRLPVITTLMGKSAFPESHELHFGWPGMHGPKWSNLAMNTCDVLVAVGARFDDRVTGKLSAFAPGATVIHLDIDAAEISKLRQADVPVVGPLKQAVAELAREVARERHEGAPVPEAWLRRIAEWRDEFPLRYGARRDSMKPQWVIQQLQALTADDDVIVTTGVGQHQMWAMQYVVSNRPRSFITSGGLGTMGYGIPAAIGAKAARPEATVACVDGDGCFQMTAQELVTAVLEDLPIVVVLINNGYLGMVQQWQDMFFDGRRSHVHLTHQVPDYARLAEAYGALGLTVDAEDELVPALQEALSSGRTAVVDCRVEQSEQCFPMIPAGAAALELVEYTEPEETGARAMRSDP
jgi:acetolactate synthase I/II/III large subunit